MRKRVEVNLIFNGIHSQPNQKSRESGFKFESRSEYLVLLPLSFPVTTHTLAEDDGVRKRETQDIFLLEPASGKSLLPWTEYYSRQQQPIVCPYKGLVKMAIKIYQAPTHFHQNDKKKQWR